MQSRILTNLPELNKIKENGCKKWAIKAQASKKPFPSFPYKPRESEMHVFL